MLPYPFSYFQVFGDFVSPCPNVSDSTGSTTLYQYLPYQLVYGTHCYSKQLPGDLSARNLYRYVYEPLTDEVVQNLSEHARIVMVN